MWQKVAKFKGAEYFLKALYIYIYIYIYINFSLTLYLLFSPFSWYSIVSNYYLVSSLQLPYGLGRDEGRKPPKHNPTKPHCFLTQCASNPETSRPYVSEVAR